MSPERVTARLSSLFSPVQATGSVGPDDGEGETDADGDALAEGDSDAEPDGEGDGDADGDGDSLVSGADADALGDSVAYEVVVATVPDSSAAGISVAATARAGRDRARRDLMKWPPVKGSWQREAHVVAQALAQVLMTPV